MAKVGGFNSMVMLLCIIDVIPIILLHYIKFHCPRRVALYPHTQSSCPWLSLKNSADMNPYKSYKEMNSPNNLSDFGCGSLLSQVSDDNLTLANTFIKNAEDSAKSGTDSQPIEGKRWTEGRERERAYEYLYTNIYH